MVAKIIDGAIIAQDVLNEVADRLREAREKVPGFSVTLAVVQVLFDIFNKLLRRWGIVSIRPFI